MNALPVVTVSRTDGGHRVQCSCTWSAFRYSRPAADQLATEHRAGHGSGRQLDRRTTTKEATR